MQFKDMYDKPIDRRIDAVVKAADFDQLANELEEYVITPELAGHLNRFFDEYNDPDATGNGAWISGFFGSGKSHMLKILAVLLEDQEVAGKPALDYILPKLEDDPGLSGAMQSARAKHPSESILFNIDIVAPNQGRTEAGGLLAAFIKVFNKHCGYFDGDQQHIAQMEYDLDREGRLQAFIDEAESTTGKRWEDLRKSALIYAPKITAAFDKACGNEPGTTENVIRYYQQTYQPSIRSFAERVKEYIDAHGPGFRLNFFVDEVGQFIAQNANLMVNLQSVAEELNTVCDGASWVIVTSQENMEDIVGQMTERSANDFSKIQARFKVKMQLTSKDAKAVIKQRLLAKNKNGQEAVSGIYFDHEQDFRVLFDFADGSKHYKGYEDEADFIATYPFVPYQFDLFITAMRGLSDYNAFTGRHHSTGARSMLGVFQMVGISLSRNDGSTEQQNLAPFDAMFEGLRNSLKSEVYGAITQAETNLADDPMAIRVLKALLLVKYCKDFKATPGNIRVLLFSSFKENAATLEQQIKDALAELERQLYIKRSPNSNSYEYLTDEEKDIEKEIRNTTIQTSEVRDYIGTAFRDIVGATKAVYENGKFSHSFPYNLKIDGDAQGKARYDLSLDIVTEAPSGPLDVPPSAPKTLTVVLQGGNEFMNNVSTFVKTQKFVNIANTAGEVRNAIVADKRQGAQALSAKLREDLKGLIAEARFYAAGMDVTEEVGGSGKDAVASAMGLLIKRSYTELQQIKTNFSEKDVFENCIVKQSSMEGTLPEYANTVLSRIGLMGSASTVTVGGDGNSSLTAFFTKNEYGWPDIAVRNAVAVLYANNRIEVRQAGSSVDGQALASALKSGRELDKLVVEKMTDVSPERLAQINSSFRDYVKTNPVNSDAKSIAAELADHLGKDLAEYRSAETRAASYPFAGAYSENLGAIERAQSALKADWKWLADQYPEKSKDVAKSKDELAAMKQFVEGSPISVKWNEIKDFGATKLTEARELDIPLINDGTDLEDALAVADDPECYKSREIPRASSVIKRAIGQIDEAKAALRESAKLQLADYRESFESSYDLGAVPLAARERFGAVFESAERELGAEQSVYRIKSFMASFKQAHGADIVMLLTPAPESESHPDEETGQSEAPAPAKPKVKTVSVGSLSLSSYGKPTIETEEDVDKYLSALRESLMGQIANGNVVMR